MSRTTFITALADWALLPLRAWRDEVACPPELAPAGLVDADHAINALAHVIEAARQQAIADGVRTVPASISRSLFGYFPPALLRRVRFASGRAGPLTLPEEPIVYGNATAMTLSEVVLFRTERDAQLDLNLWARELTHVVQYQRWGVGGFADKYVHDCKTIEQEATDNASSFMSWLSRRGQFA